MHCSCHGYQAKPEEVGGQKQDHGVCGMSLGQKHIGVMTHSLLRFILAGM
jgi:hypothetical protein